MKKLWIAACAFLIAAPVAADGGVTFTDIADGGGAGVTFEHTPTSRLQPWLDLVENGIPAAGFRDFAARDSPVKPWGSPGTAIFDYDRDGDLDIYVTNSENTNNSLLQSQLAQTGQLTFVDVGAASGAGAFAQESSGVCYGDTDNDGDHDLFVLGIGSSPHIFFENNGDGTFTDVTSTGALGTVLRHSIGCTMADIDGDGLLDLFVGNSYGPWTNRLPVLVPGVYPGLEHNELYLNQGGNVFSNISATSGIEIVSNMPDAAFTWAVGSMDYDLDGDIDIITADNQGAPPVDKADERGWNRILNNDGNGNFTDVTVAAGMDYEGGWMGLAFADYNCDGNLDLFSTNLGNYLGGDRAPSSFFYGDGNGGFTRVVEPDMPPNPFGWGTSPIDYDNDGDTDLMYVGSVDNIQSIVADNPGALWTNNGACSGTWTYADGVILKDHRSRNAAALAVGDLDEDGFTDMVSVSNFDFTPRFFFPWVGFLSGPRGGVFDNIAAIELAFFQFTPGLQEYLYPLIEGGSTAVEINSGDNGNGSLEVRVVGSAGILPGGNVNRDGIGAVVKVENPNLPTSMKPVVGGSSFGSQDSLRQVFGLGQEAGGDVEVFWQGGIKNRLYDVAAGEQVTVPFIPCSYDGSWKNFGQYNSCVMQALNAYKDAGVISASEKNRLRDSARRAFDEANAN